MMILAALFLGLSAALFFGPQLVAYGADDMRNALRRPEAFTILGGLLTAFVLLLFAPHAGSALISGGEAVQVVTTKIMGLSFG